VTLNLENVDRADPKPEPTPTPVRAAKPFWRRPWILPLAAVVLVYLYLQFKPIVTVPQDQLLLPPHADFPPYFPLLITHMSGGTLAMLTMCLQLWPWLRVHHPKAHRVTGLVYIAGAVIGGSAGLVIVWWAPASGKLGGVCMLLFWVTVTISAYVAARRGNYVAHRRFMLYSFAVVANNFWAFFSYLAIQKLGIVINPVYFLEYERWIPWVGNLMLVQWWLYRTARLRTPFADRRI
jgi:hypothetical protein